MHFASRLGRALLIFGVGSIVLSFLNMNFVILAWIDLWGDAVGWAIRLGMIGAGGVLLALPLLSRPSAVPTQTPSGPVPGAQNFPG
jgi:hypothetical protein